MTPILSDLDAARERLKAAVPASGYLTYEQAAELARCSPRTIQRAIRSGHLKAFRPVKRVLISEPDLRAWIESEAAPSTQPAPPQPHRARRSEPGSVASLKDLERRLG